MPHVKIFDTGDTSSREKQLSNGINMLLMFDLPEDEKMYMTSLKNLFHFPTFWPTILLYLIFTLIDARSIDTRAANVFGIITSVFSLINTILISLFTIAQAIDYLVPKFVKLKTISNYILRQFISGRIEDLVLVVTSFANGFSLLNVASANLCSSCQNPLLLDECTDGDAREFPLNQALFGYITILILPIYFKSMKRHIVMLAWLIQTIFMFATYVEGGYKFYFFVILVMAFFFVSMYEYERFKMTSYLLSKEALLHEKNKMELMAEKAKIIERKLNLALVHQILPPKVADAIRQGKQVEPESFPDVTIFFSDVVGFTNICAAVTPIQVVRMLNELYTVMDYCTSQFPLYKVETIGDAYMVAGGIPQRDPRHAEQVADFALLVRNAVNLVRSPADGSPLQIRIGMHSGPVMAGVVGNIMPRYCLFGDTVNTASRMESNGVKGMIHCSEAAATILKAKGKHILEKRGDIEIKGKGIMSTYWLESAMPDNENSNERAIARLQLNVTEILEASNEESDILNEPMSPGRLGDLSDLDGAISPSTTTSASFFENSGDIGIERTGNRGSLSSISSFGRGSAGSLAQMRHNRRYSSRGKGVNESVDSISAGAKILVVEDSVAQRKVLMRNLQKADSTWDISAATSGEDALQKLKAARLMYDVVFVDENLSANDGLFGHELVQVMRDSFNMYRCVIVACTSNPAKVSEALKAAGVDLVWPKPPPKPDFIKTKIDELIATKMGLGSSNRGDCKTLG